MNNRYKTTYRAITSGRERVTRSTGMVITMLAIGCLPVGCVSAAEPVINFRHGGTGAYPDADPPLEWSFSKNVKWRWDAGLMAETYATPIIVGDRVITLARSTRMIALDKDSGKALWRCESYLTGAKGEGDVTWRLHEHIRKMHRLYEVEALLAPEKMIKGKARRTGPLVSLERGFDSFARKVGDDAAGRAYFEDLRDQAEDLRTAVDADTERSAALEQERAELVRWKAALEKPWSKLGGKLGCAGSPASDGERIYAVFSPGLLVCVGLDGEPLWAHAIVEESDRGPRFGASSWGRYTVAESPVCADGKVLAQAGNLVHCLDGATGRLLWSRWQTSNRAACAVTPAIARSGGVWYWMTGDGCVGRLDDGTVLLEAQHGGMYHFWSLACAADQRTFHYVRGAVRLPDTPEGKPRQLWAMPETLFRNKHADDKTWIIEGGHSYFAPVVHDGILYFLETAGGGRLTAMEAETGEVVYGPIIAKERREELGRGGFVDSGHKHPGAYSDLNLAGGHLIMFSLYGDSIVLKAGRDFGVVRRNPRIGTTMVTNPMFEGRRMYVRTDWSLFCFEKPNEGEDN